MLSTRPAREYFLAALTLSSIAFPSTADASATYSQNFDDLGGGIPSLQSAGWIFRDQSSPGSAGWWTSSWAVTTGFPPSSQAGAGHLAFETTWNLQATTQVSAWSILPSVPGQVAGDILEFHTAGAYFATGAVEVRYSPSGSTGTGVGPTALGDFTTLLASFSPTNGAPYEKRSLTIPGSGRIAFRVLGTGYPMFANSPHFQLDSLRFNPPPGPFPIPAPGQSVTWTLAMSPIVVTSDVAIPATAKVTVEAGVEIRLAEGKRIDVTGTLEVNGTAAAEVEIVRIGNGAALVPYAKGEIDLDHVSLDVRIEPRNGARILATDCTFHPYASIANAAMALLEPDRSVLRLERCSFAGSTVQVDNVMAYLRDVTFDASSSSSDVMLFGYVRLEDVSVDGACLRLGKEHGIQPVFVDSVTVRNSAARGGLYLQGGTDFLLGPNNVLENDLWPVEFGVGCAGLLPGSVVPTSGNVNDFVIDTIDSNPQATVTWAKIATPYVARGARYLGYQKILPGVHIRFQQDASWRSQVWGSLDAIGTADSPIVFEAFLGGQSWVGLQMFNATEAQRLEHCVFRGAAIAVAAKNVQFESCRFENNELAVTIGDGSWAQMRSCRFSQNSIAVNGESIVSIQDGSALLGTTTNPNSFAGNGVAVRASNGPLPNSGAGNWWGHPTGPKHPTLNPQGQGDVIQPYSAFPIQPFLTAPPSYTDAPPQVRFADGRIVTVEPGKTLLLSWTANDDHAIVAQRVYFSASGLSPLSMSQLPSTLTPNQRTLAFTVPAVGQSSNGDSAFLRIEVVDDSGQIARDELELYVTDTSLAGTVTLTTPLAGRSFVPGDALPVTYTTAGVSPIVAPSVVGRIVLDNDREVIHLGGATYTAGSLPLGITMPDVSTDRARLALVLTHSLNQVSYFFSEPFTIRPDAALGDAPPVVSISSPSPGDTFLAGEILPIRFTATDDEALRSFDVLVSTDGGARFTVVALDLPGDVREYDWRLPPGIALNSAMVLVVAHDHRFQNSSDSATFDVEPADACQPNLGYGKVGGPLLAICGASLATGSSASLSLIGAPASQPGVLLLATSLLPTPALGWILATMPVVAMLPFGTNGGGQYYLPNVPGGNGPFTIYLQAAVADPSTPVGGTLSNALRVEFLP